MPTISVNLSDLQSLLGRDSPAMAPEQIETLLPLVKGELKDWDTATGELRIELQDSNRPDLWCAEGIARQIRLKRATQAPRYPFFADTERPKRKVLVAPGLAQVRPYIAACAAIGYCVTETGLTQLIQAQEKLADIFGHRRRTVSIGIYRMDPIVFPVSYTLVGPDEARFVPLGFSEKMTLREILSVHPKGQDYGDILAGHERLPLLRDAEGQILSFPPIINSRQIGEVIAGDEALFVEVTGMDHRMVVLTLNILAVNLADRGAAIEPVLIEYPNDTELGQTVRTPLDLGNSRVIPVGAIGSALGEALDATGIRSALQTYGYELGESDEPLSVTLPPYRNDLMHVVDVVEDVAISRGYGSFTPVMPSQFTVGGLSPLEECADRVRDLMVGQGFQEIMSNILSSRTDLVERMRIAGTDWDRLVDVDNVMVQTYASLRHSLLPSLLRVEESSSRAFYPHRVFEVGEAAVPAADSEVGSRTITMLAGLIAHARANFSEIHSCLDLLMFYLGCAYQLVPTPHPSFLEGRVGRIEVEGATLGYIGELHPEVLERWQIMMPCAAFEMELDALARRGL
jgi:phenylalanyl-tRNA synthetase beta chain